MEDRIVSGLNRLFDQHRIVFWYDDKQEFIQIFESLSLPNVQKLRLENNAFGLKYRMLREEPEQKFLLYTEHAAPANIDNWLLDIQLSNAVFHSDQSALWLDELGLPMEFRDIVVEHVAFFRSGKRLRALKKQLTRTDTKSEIRMKMLSIAVGAEPNFNSIMYRLLQDYAEEKSDLMRGVERYNLEVFLWQRAERDLGYLSETPGIEDFAVTVFQSYYEHEIGGEPALRHEALPFVRTWKDSRRFVSGFETLSARLADDLGVAADIRTRDIQELLKIDVYELIEKKILSDLVRGVNDRTYAAHDVEGWINERRRLTSHWYDAYAHLYEAIQCASQLLSRVDRAQFTIRDVAAGIERYCDSWFEVDQLYRKYIYHSRKADATDLLSGLSTTVENYYSNIYLLRLNNAFSEVLDSQSAWDARPFPKQSSFFESKVRPYLHEDKKLVVIISDAMRYEIGEELSRRIRSEDRYSAEISPMLSMLPSYTQLGMASLLPNNTLEVLPDASVRVDGMSATGMINREKVLQKGRNGAVKTLQYSQVRDMRLDELREIVREHVLLYVYHDHIDATGDKRDTEDRVFEAAETTLDELVSLVKKLNNGNVNNMLITADHGFIYQNQPLDRSDFSGDFEPQGEVQHRSRRFVMGEKLLPARGAHTFSAEQLGLVGNVMVQVPRSINRLSVRGAGSRFVHGGASLQEVVVPVIHVNKSRSTDVREVDVDIIRSGNTRITTGQLAMVFYQKEAVTEKIKGRQMRAALYTAEGVRISDEHELTFDSESDNPRDREQRVQFILTPNASEVKNGERVYLRLEAKIPKTSRYTEYERVTFEMQRSFTSDFDF